MYWILYYFDEIWTLYLKNSRKQKKSELQSHTQAAGRSQFCEKVHFGLTQFLFVFWVAFFSPIAHIIHNSLLDILNCTQC